MLLFTATLVVLCEVIRYTVPWYVGNTRERDWVLGSLEQLTRNAGTSSGGERRKVRYDSA